MMRDAVAAWRDLGLACELVPVAKAQYWQMVAGGEPEFFRFGWIADYPDAVNFFDLFYSGSGENLAHYQDARFDSLFERAAGDTDPGHLARLYHAMEDRLLETMPAVFLHHDRNALLVRDEVRDFDLSVNPMWRRRYKYVWLASRG